MKRSTLLISLAAVAVIACTAGVAIAQPYPGRDDGPDRPGQVDADRGPAQAQPPRMAGQQRDDDRPLMGRARRGQFGQGRPMPGRQGRAQPWTRPVPPPPTPDKGPAQAGPPEGVERLGLALRVVRQMAELLDEPEAAAVLAIGAIKDELPPERASQVLERLLGATESLPLRNAIRITLKDLYKSQGKQDQMIEQLSGLIVENDRAIRGDDDEVDEDDGRDGIKQRQIDEEREVEKTRDKDKVRPGDEERAKDRESDKDRDDGRDR